MNYSMGGMIMETKGHKKLRNSSFFYSRKCDKIKDDKQKIEKVIAYKNICNF